MERGTVVMIRTAFNQPIVRRVAECQGDKVKVCTNEVYSAWIRGEREPVGAIFPKNRVFLYDATLFGRMKIYDDRIDELPDELERMWQEAQRAE